MLAGPRVETQLSSLFENKNLERCYASLFFFFFFFFFFFLFSFQLNDPWTSSFEQRKRRELSFGFCRSLWLVLSYWLFHFFFFFFLFVCTDLNLKKFDFLFRFNVKVINFIINEIILSYRLVIYWLLKMFNWIIPLNF